MSTPSTNTAATETPAPAKKFQPLKAENMRIQATGFCFREVVLALPEGMSASDAIEDTSGTLFGILQKSTGRLTAGDRVYLMGFGRSFICAGWVTAATDNKVDITPEKVISLPVRTAALPSTEKYRVAFSPLGGYHVEEIETGIVVSPAVASVAVAKNFMMDKYPRQV